MGFTLQRVFGGRVVVAGQRQNMAADLLLMELQQFAHQFCNVDAKRWQINLGGCGTRLASRC